MMVIIINVLLIVKLLISGNCFFVNILNKCMFYIDKNSVMFIDKVIKISDCKKIFLNNVLCLVFNIVCKVRVLC